MQPADKEPELSIASLTPRESELLRKAGERVFALSRRLAAKETEAEQLRFEARSLRDLLAESREVRQVLSAQVASMQTELDREYEERSELRRLLASLHMQMQELLPVVTGLSRLTLATPEEAVQPERSPTGERRKPERGHKSLSQRLLATALSEFKAIRKTPKRR